MKESVSRRSVLAAGAAGMVLTNGVGRALAQAAGKTINVAIVGAGVQGRILLRDALDIPGVRFVAACDIWSYSQTYAKNMIYKYNRMVHKLTDKPAVFTDYKELLAKKSELKLDVIINATPDCWHAPITIAALEAGLHVYCEKEMAPTIEKSREMVVAANKSGKCCQIGHQRRSNPDYIEALKLIRDTTFNLVGTVKTCYGQWNRLFLYRCRLFKAHGIKPFHHPIRQSKIAEFHGVNLSHAEFRCADICSFSPQTTQFQSWQ